MDEYIEIKPLDEEFLHQQELEQNARIELHSDANHCKYCESDFFSQEQFYVHLLGHVNGQLQDCEACVKGFPTEERLVKHIMDHIESSLYDSCTYVARSNMQTLQRVELPKAPIAIIPVVEPAHRDQKDDATSYEDQTHKCNSCTQNFKYKMELFKHMMVHVEKCRVCQKAIQKHLLPQHMLTHTHSVQHAITGETLLICNVCCKSCSQSVDLTEHMLTHIGQQPFKCGLCTQGFAQRSQLLKHLKSPNVKHESPKGGVVLDETGCGVKVESTVVKQEEVPPD